MKRGLKWIVAGSLMTAGALVAGCPEEVSPSDVARPAPAKVRDYLFPASATATFVYEETVTQWLPSNASPNVSTSSFQLKTLQLERDQVVYAYSELREGWKDHTSTHSLKAAPDGTVTLSLDVTDKVVLELLSFPDAALTKAGAIVSPASGSWPAVRMSRLGAETVTVPAGTFETIKVRQQMEDGKGAPNHYWLAKGKSYWGVKQARISTRSSELEDGISTTSTEVVLKSFTP